MSNKVSKLLCWIKSRGFATSYEIKRWGLENFYSQVDRRARELVCSGILSRMDDERKMLLGIKKKFAVYEVA